MFFVKEDYGENAIEKTSVYALFHELVFCEKAEIWKEAVKGWHKPYYRVNSESKYMCAFISKFSSVLLEGA